MFCVALLCLHRYILIKEIKLTHLPPPLSNLDDVSYVLGNIHVNLRSRIPSIYTVLAWCLILFCMSNVLCFGTLQSNAVYIARMLLLIHPDLAVSSNRIICILSNINNMVCTFILQISLIVPKWYWATYNYKRIWRIPWQNATKT